MSKPEALCDRQRPQPGPQACSRQHKGRRQSVFESGMAAVWQHKERQPATEGLTSAGDAQALVLPQIWPVGGLRRSAAPVQEAPQPRTAGWVHSPSQEPSLQPTWDGGPGGPGGGKGGGGGGGGGGGSTLGRARLGNSVTGACPAAALLPWPVAVPFAPLAEISLTNSMPPLPPWYCRMLVVMAEQLPAVQVRWTAE